MKCWQVVVIVVLGGMTASAQILQRSVISSGAQYAANSYYRIQGTIGQSIIGPVHGNYLLGQGFWYQQSEQLSSVERTAPFYVRITPQPVTSVALVELRCNNQSSAELLSLRGQKVQSVVFTSDNTLHSGQIDCSDLASGMYIVRVWCGKEHTIVPVMVAK